MCNIILLHKNYMTKEIHAEMLKCEHWLLLVKLSFVILCIDVHQSTKK